MKSSVWVGMCKQVLIGCVCLTVISCNEGLFDKTVSSNKFASETTPSANARLILANESFETFRHHKGYQEAPPSYENANVTETPVLHLATDSKGMPRGVWSYAKNGLGTLASDVSHSEFAITFIENNIELWGLHSGTLSSDKVEFVVRSEQEMTSPGGRKVTRIEFDQHLDGNKILDGGMGVTFWDNVLTSVQWSNFNEG